MIEITQATATLLMSEVVAMYGRDYVDPRAGGGQDALYVADGKPGCLIGHILARAGVPLADLAAAEGLRVSTLFGCDLTVDGRVIPGSRPGVARAEPTVVQALVYTQAVQDAGMNWGTAEHTYRMNLLLDRADRLEAIAPEPVLAAG